MDDDALVYLAIIRLHGRYADIATRRAWDEMADLAGTDSRFSFELPTGQVLERSASMRPMGTGPSSTVAITTRTRGRAAVGCSPDGRSRS